MNRRSFIHYTQQGLTKAGTLWLASLGNFGLTALGASVNSSTNFDGKLKVDKTNAKLSYVAQETDWKIIEGISTKIWSFNKNNFAMPIIAEVNSNIDVRVKNLINKQSIGIHWHGIRLPNNMDGVPGLTQPPIGFNDSFRYKYSSPDAGTFWYHTHSNSLEQLRRGLIGPLIIKESKNYPVDEDIIIMMNDWLLNRNGQLPKNPSQFTNQHFMSHDGMLGNVITVNGKVNPSLVISPHSRLRLRFINGATTRIFAPEISTALNPYVIAYDGNPVPVRKYQKVTLAPGMRMDVIVDIKGNLSNTAQRIYDNSYSLPIDLFTLKTTGNPIRKNVLKERPPQLPKNPIPKPNLNRAKKYRLELGGGAMSPGMMMGMFSGLFWALNGERMGEDHNYNKPLFSFKRNESVLLELHNNTSFAHPIHMHGYIFWIMSINGNKLKEPLATDTIYLNPDQNADIAVVMDNPGKWMIHCHIIDHQVSGMMGIFEVV